MGAEPARQLQAVLLVERWPGLRREHKDAWQALAENWGGETILWSGPEAALLAQLAVAWRCSVSAARRRVVGLRSARLLAVQVRPSELRLRVVFPRRLPAPRARPLRTRGKSDGQGQLFRERPELRVIDAQPETVSDVVLTGTVSGCAAQPKTVPDAPLSMGPPATRAKHVHGMAWSEDEKHDMHGLPPTAHECMRLIFRTIGPRLQPGRRLNRAVVKKAVACVYELRTVPAEEMVKLLWEIEQIREEGLNGLSTGFTKGPTELFGYVVSRWPGYVRSGKPSEVEELAGIRPIPREEGRQEFEERRAQFVRQMLGTEKPSDGKPA